MAILYRETTEDEKNVGVSDKGERMSSPSLSPSMVEESSIPPAAAEVAAPDVEDEDAGIILRRRRVDDAADVSGPTPAPAPRSRPRQQQQHRPRSRRPTFHALLVGEMTGFPDNNDKEERRVMGDVGLYRSLLETMSMTPEEPRRDNGHGVGVDVGVGGIGQGGGGVAPPPPSSALDTESVWGEDSYMNVEIGRASFRPAT